MTTVMLAGPRGGWPEGCASVLTESGCRVETADTGLDCLARLRAGWTDLLVLSADLPWGGGDGVLAVMRDDPWLGQIPVVVADPRGLQSGQAGMPDSPVVRVFSSPPPPTALLALLAERGHRPGDDDRFELLVVDDDPGVRRLLQGFFGVRGHRVWAAADGEEALDLCCEHGEHIAAVLLDVHMPGLDGPHTFEGLRAYDPSLPVCLMSGGVTDAEAADLLRIGARHVFRKPFRLEEVGRVVRHLANEPRATAVRHRRMTD